MKKLLFLLVVFALAVPAQAEAQQLPPLSNPECHDMCDAAGGLSSICFHIFWGGSMDACETASFCMCASVGGGGGWLTAPSLFAALATMEPPNSVEPVCARRSVFELWAE